jgi:hypothetical protein
MRGFRFVACFWFWASFVGVEMLLSQGHTVSIDGVDVDVSTITRYATTRGSSVYEIEVKYRADRPFVLNGQPRLAGSGVLVFLSNEPRLDVSRYGIESGHQAVVLTNIDLPAAGITTIKDVPDIGDFPPPALRLFANKDDAINEQKVVAALNRYFPPGPLPLTFTRPFRLVSYSRVLDTVHSPFRGKVAIMVEFPVESTDRAHAYRLSWVAYESRIGSSAWPKATKKEIVAAAQQYVDRFVDAVGR